MSLEFNMPKDTSSILKVIGVGGGGSNAVNHMYAQGIKGVDFIICNTDQQALDISPVPIKVQIGQTLTGGRGAGAQPEVGRNAAVESIDEIKEILEDNTTMVFITAGMGGGTGTGAAPVIAQTAKEMGILTVGIVTIPFKFEGPRRKKLAEEGLAKLRDSVDTLLIIKNDKLREVCGNLSVSNAFNESDNILTTAAKGIAEVISSIGYINVDMNDVNTVMKDSGVAIMGSASATGSNRAQQAVTEALESPLLNDNNIKGARHVLLNITFGTEDITMDELDEITHYIQTEAGDTAEVIMGYGQDERLGDEISVTVIATGFEGGDQPTAGYEDEREPEKVYRKLEEDVPTIITAPPLEGTEITRPLESPMGNSSQSDAGLTQSEVEDIQPFIKGSEEHDFTDQPLAQDLGSDITDLLGGIKTANQAEEDYPEDATVGSARFSIDETEEMKQAIERENDLDPQMKDEAQFTPPSAEAIEDAIAATEEIEEVERPSFGLTFGASIEEEQVEEPQAEEPVAKPNFFQLFDEEPKQDEHQEIAAEHQEDDYAEEEVKEEPRPMAYELKLDDASEPVFTEMHEPAPKAMERPVYEPRVNTEEQKRSNEQRLERVREHGLKLRTPSGLSELENEPAYRRKNIDLEDTPHSSESKMSRFTLTDNNTEGMSLSKKNPFLDKNVD